MSLFSANRSRSIRPTLSTLLVLLLGLAMACGPEVVIGTGGEYDEEAIMEEVQEWWDAQDIIVVPWTYVLDDEIVESAIVEEDRLIFPANTYDEIDSLTELDIIVSAHLDASFLRRILEIEHQGDDIILHTRIAGLEEAIVKADFYTDLGEEILPEYEDLESQQGLLRQATFSSRRGVSSEETQDFEVSPGPLKIKGQLHYRTFTGLGVDLRIASNFWEQTHGVSVAEGLRYCTNRNSCFRAEECLNTNRCAYQSARTRTTCQQVIRDLSFGDENPSCARQWERWWGNPNSGVGEEDRNCSRGGAVRDTVLGPIRAPYPAQIEWAKEACSGRVEEFQTRFDHNSRLELRNVSIIGTLLSVEDKDNAADVRLPGRRGIFMAGKLPVVYNLRPSVRMSAAASGSGSVSWNSTRNFSLQSHFTTGITYTNTGGWTFQSPSLNLTPTGFRGGDDASYLAATAEGKLELSVGPRISLLFYEVAGPFIDPASLVGGMDLKLEFATRQSPYCHMGFRAGLQGQIGVEAGLPFTTTSDGPTFQLYDHCGGNTIDYCSESAVQTNPPCVRTCLFGCGGLQQNRVVLTTDHFGEEPYGLNDPYGFVVGSIHIERQIGSNTTPQIFYADRIENLDGNPNHDEEVVERLFFSTLNSCVPPDEWEEEVVVFNEELIVSFGEDFEFEEGDLVVIGRPNFHPGDICPDANECIHPGEGCRASGTANVYIANQADRWRIFEGLHGSNYPITVEANHLQQ